MMDTERQYLVTVTAKQGAYFNPFATALVAALIQEVLTDSVLGLSATFAVSTQEVDDDRESDCV